MDYNQFRIKELKERIFLVSNNKFYEKNSNIFNSIKEKNLTILMTPFTNFKQDEVNIPNKKYYNSVLNHLRYGENPSIILSDYNLDRLIIETLKGELKSPRIFIQSCTANFKGFGYYKNENTLEEIVSKINPKIIEIGGGFLGSSEDELNNWDLSKYPWENSMDAGDYVDGLYLLFRDKYPTKLAKNLVLKI
jgi:hypothetical protein